MVEALNTQTISQKLKTDISVLYQENQRRLKVPSSRQRIGVTKMRSFLFFFGLFFMLLLAFAAGYLTSYTFYPPQMETLSLSSLSPVPEDSLSPEHRIVNPEHSYAARAAKIKQNQGMSILERSQNQAEFQAKQQARNAVSQVLQNWSSKIRDTFGQYVGSALVPVTTGLVRSAADSFLAPQGTTIPSERHPVNKEMADKTSENPSTDPKDSLKSLHSLERAQTDFKKFSIQIQAYDNSQQAWNLARTLNEKGLGSYVVRIEENQRLSFVVRVGTFKTYKESQEAAKLMMHQHQIPARVVTIHPFEERLK